MQRRWDPNLDDGLYALELSRRKHAKNQQTVRIEPALRALQAPTQIVWGTADPLFSLEWAYWLKNTIAGARRVIELEGAKLFHPEERPDALAAALRELWTDPSVVRS